MRITLQPGQTAGFVTRPGDGATKIIGLQVPPVPDDLAGFSWHIEACCQPIHYASGSADVYGWGAIVTVRNIQYSGAIEVWTDYI